MKKRKSVCFFPPLFVSLLQQIIEKMKYRWGGKILCLRRTLTGPWQSKPVELLIIESLFENAILAVDMVRELVCTSLIYFSYHGVQAAACIETKCCKLLTEISFILWTKRLICKTSVCFWFEQRSIVGQISRLYALSVFLPATCRLGQSLTFSLELNFQ